MYLVIDNDYSNPISLDTFISDNSGVYVLGLTIGDITQINALEIGETIYIGQVSVSRVDNKDNK